MRRKPTNYHGVTLAQNSILGSLTYVRTSISLKKNSGGFVILKYQI